MDEDKSLQAWIRDMSDGLAPIRCTAAYELGKNGDSQAVAALALALKDDYLSVRRYSAQSLGMIGHGSAVAPLIEALGDTDCEVRDLVLEALGKITDQSFLTGDEWRDWFGETREWNPKG